MSLVTAQRATAAVVQGAVVRLVLPELAPLAARLVLHPSLCQHHHRLNPEQLLHHLRSVAPAARPSGSGPRPTQRARRGPWWRVLRPLCLFQAVAGAAGGALGRTARLLATGASLGLSGLFNSATLTGVLLGGLSLQAAGAGVTRLLTRRLGRRRVVSMSGQGPGAAQQLSVVTFNVRGIMDRWEERAPHAAAALAAVDADVVAFQEVLTGEFAQEVSLLGAGYQVAPCKAALTHLGQGAGLWGACLAGTYNTLLSWSWGRSLLLSLPVPLEQWRERYQLGGAWARALRDLAMAPFFGNSIASRVPLCPSTQPEVLLLGGWRAAQRVCLLLSPTPSAPAPSSGAATPPGVAATPAQQQQQQQTKAGSGGVMIQAEPAAVAAAVGAVGRRGPGVCRVWLVNTHLDHADDGVRAQQMQAICRWMEGIKPGAAGVVLTGDLNAHPGEAVHGVLRAHGYVSCHEAVHGSEPTSTWPSGLTAPLADEGDPTCADYIYAWSSPGPARLEVRGAGLVGDTPAAHDPGLYPSDHLGLKVVLRVVEAGTPGAAPRQQVMSGDGTTTSSSSEW